jgi:hypothetical protein
MEDVLWQLSCTFYVIWHGKATLCLLIGPMDWATFNLAVGAALAAMILAR